MKRFLLVTLLLTTLLTLSGAWASQDTPSSIDLPGTQPLEVANLESPNKCDNCHGGYNSAVEPAFNWRGSMMANAGRDPIFWATLAVTEQNFGGAGDLCLRCHSTSGWLAGRSEPTDGSGLAAGDSDGVDCDYCHQLTNPDTSEHLGVQVEPFLAHSKQTPPVGYYGSGMGVLWGGSDKLGPYSDADARHQFLQSRFHRSVDFCGTCHDVSNSAVGNLAHNFGAQAEFLQTTVLSSDDAVSEDPKDYSHKVAFNYPPYQYGVVERTFSEFKAGAISKTRVNDYSTLPAELQAGALEAIYLAASKQGTISADFEDGSPRYYSCQSCHMRPLSGKGSNKNSPYRLDLALHDMTGGNYWIPEAIKYLDAQNRLRLGGGLTALQNEALDAGALRAMEQLDLAASLSVSGNTVKIINHTGHKLISGYPEGRRMWLNIQWRNDAGTLLREDGAYGPISVVLDGTTTQVNSLLDPHDPNTRIYDAHYGMDKTWAADLLALGFSADVVLAYDRHSSEPTLTLGQLAADPNIDEAETFHFVLNNRVLADNRIPPYGMSYESARARNTLPVPADQYSGGPGKTYDYFDTLSLNPPAGATNATIDLLYQPTSWEYIQFLYLANSLPAGAFLADEGRYLLEAWQNTGMAEPYVMASATWGTAASCQSPTPTLLSATPDNGQVTLNWSDQHTADSNIASYNVYYDQAGKAQFIANAGLATTFVDSGLTNGQNYCYKVTSYKEDGSQQCESEFSNIICAIPNNQGQARVHADLSTGRYETSGKGKNKVITFVSSDLFNAGDAVVIRALVTDQASGIPVANATVTIEISGPESLILTAGPTGNNGIAEISWQTTAPNKRGRGGTATGSYTATTTDVNAAGFSWDGDRTTAAFVLQ